MRGVGFVLMLMGCLELFSGDVTFQKRADPVKLAGTKEHPQNPGSVLIESVAGYRRQRIAQDLGAGPRRFSLMVIGSVTTLCSTRLPEVFLKPSSELAGIVPQFAKLLWGGNVLERLSINSHGPRLITWNRCCRWLVRNMAKYCADDVAIPIANQCKLHN
jgi:hypothetical protein